MSTDDARGQLQPVYYQRTIEEVQTVSGTITVTGLEAFDAEVNGLIADGWRRDGKSEAVRVSDNDTILLQRLVRDVPLDEILGGVDDSEG